MEDDVKILKKIIVRDNPTQESTTQARGETKKFGESNVKHRQEGVFDRRNG
mgnify:FL=1